jgi:hypothetical protein
MATATPAPSIGSALTVARITYVVVEHASPVGSIVPPGTGVLLGLRHEGKLSVGAWVGGEVRLLVRAH